MQLRRVSIDPKRTGLTQFIFAISSAQQSDTEHTRPAGGQDVPDCVANHIAIDYTDTQALLACQEEIRFGLGTRDIATLDDDCLPTDAEYIQRCIDLWTSTRGCNPKENLVGF